MSGRPRRRQSGTGPASPAQQEEVGEGELARVLAAVEALTSQVGDISTAVQQQQQGLEEVRRERAREAEEAAVRASEEGREEPSERSGAARQPVAQEGNPPRGWPQGEAPRRVQARRTRSS